MFPLGLIPRLPKLHTILNSNCRRCYLHGICPVLQSTPAITVNKRVIQKLSQQLQMKRLLPYRIPCEILKLGILPSNSENVIYFQPAISKCSLCNSSLGEPVFPRGSSGKDGNGILLTYEKPFVKCTIKVKICQNLSCMAINQVSPYESGKLFEYYL